MNAFRSNSAVQGDLLPPEAPTRGRVAGVQPVPSDVIDVDFEVVRGESRRSAYPVFNDNSKGKGRAREKGRSGSSTLTVERGRFFPAAGVQGVERLLQRVSRKVFAGCVATVCLSVFVMILSGRDTTAQVPVTAPLLLDHVTTALGDANGLKVISVFGSVENRAAEPRTVPAILVDVIDNGHRTATISVPFEARPLASGETRPFSVRLPHAGGKVPDVRLSFNGTDAPAL